MREAAAMFSLFCGVMMPAVWGVLLGTGNVPELKTTPLQVGFLLAAELLTAVSLIVGGFGLLAGSTWAVHMEIAALGMLLCSRAGIGRVSAIGAWSHPLSIVGYVLGAIIVLIGIAALFGRNLPPLTSYHQSIAAVAAIAVLKVIVSTIHRLFLGVDRHSQQVRAMTNDTARGCAS